MEFKKKLSSSKLTKIAFTIVFLGTVIFFNPVNFFYPVRYVLSFLITPLQKILFHSSSKISGFGNFLLEIGQMKQENENLVSENQRLTVRLSQLQDIEKENEFLREQLKIIPREKFNLESAFVINRDPYGSGNWIEINKGERDGLKSGMPAIISSGIFVGKISEVFENSSKIILITSPEISMSALDVQTGSKGIIRGEYGLGVILDMVSQADLLEEGDEIVTAGTSDLVPRGLLIGKAQDIKMSKDKLFQQARVVSPVKFSKLDIVFVIVEKK